MELKSYLDEMGFHYRWFTHAEAHTASRLAATEHIPGDRVVKPVIVNLDGEFILCALPASYRIDLELLRQELNAVEVRLATEPEIQQICDCECGSEPPIGWLFGMPTLIDESLFEDDRVTFPAGKCDEAVTMSFLEYFRLAQPAVGHFSERIRSKNTLQAQ
jgi:Ala-tRNA(Pro) deacylase